MNRILHCTLPSASVSYPIEVGRGLLNELDPFKSTGSRFAIITSETIAQLYGHELISKLKKANLEAHLFSFPSGEEHKTRETKERLENQLFEKGFGRDTCIVAMGGGVVTDLAGFLASTYCRGVPLILIPTTLLAMVDASIGGKTAVNTPYGKNLIGAIYQPKKVIIDPNVLQSLPKERLREGAAEMVKHGLIANLSYFEFLEKHSEKILSLDPDLLEQAIFDSCKIKTEIVEQDEKEHGKRRLLNAGHTVAHALEQLSHYSLSHGEAVSLGLVFESYLSKQITGLSETSHSRTVGLLKNFGLPISLPLTTHLKPLISAMVLDKKSTQGRPRFVLWKEIGQPLPFDSNFCTEVDESLISNALAAINK